MSVVLSYSPHQVVSFWSLCRACNPYQCVDHVCASIVLHVPQIPCQQQTWSWQSCCMAGELQGGSYPMPQWCQLPVHAMLHQT